MREAHSVWGSTAPCSADCRVSSNLSSEERQRRSTTARAAEQIGIDDPPRLTEARHYGTEERENIQSTRNIAQAQTGAEIVSERIIFLFFYVLHPFQFFTFAPAAWRNCLLPHRSPQHPRVNSKNCGPGVRGCGVSSPSHRPQATSSGGLALCCGNRRDHFIYCRSCRDVVVRFIVVRFAVGPEQLRFLRGARLRQRRSGGRLLAKITTRTR